MSAQKLMGKRSLVLAATLVLVVSMGLPVIAHAAVAHTAPGSTAAIAKPMSGASAAATVANAPVVAPKAVSSPHPGTLVIHEVTGSGATTEDPSVAYDTVSFEPILNAYETLVAYNGSTTASYVPELSTCVPGTAGCTVDYGSSLVVNGGPTAPFGGALNGLPVYWTFPIDSHAKFFDASTGHSWPVTPIDIMYSVARTMAYSDLPFVASQNGWIITQTLLPFEFGAYDQFTPPGAHSPINVHGPFNNTPFNIMSSMLINNSTYCPAAALAAGGCITFVADGGAAYANGAFLGAGADWPFFLQTVADALGASAQSCGVFSANGAALPGFVTPIGPPNGDGSCLLPGGASSTDAPAFQAWLAGVNGTGPTQDQLWDAYQEAAENAPAIVAYPMTNLIGSGPYQAAVSLATGYTLTKNPAYVQPIGCTGGVGVPYVYVGYCDPSTSGYLGTVHVTYDSSDSASISGFGAGTIDAGGIFPEHTLTNTLPLEHSGKLSLSVAHSLSNFFYGYNMLWNPTHFASDFPTETTPTIPADFFTSEAARMFFTTAYPYLNVQNQLLSVGGIQYAFDNVCGAIPQGMGDYFPSNLSACPNSGNPDTNPSDVGGAAWWYAQGTNPVSPYYDAELAHCAITQCVLPIVGEIAATTLDAGIQQWINEIYSLSGHTVKPYEFDLSFHDLIVDFLFSSPGQMDVPIWNLGWAPDYPDPTDYMVPYYASNGGDYPFPDAVNQQLTAQNTAPNNASCGHIGVTDYWAYNAAVAQLTTNCEGIAWNAAQSAINAAAPLSDTPVRVGLYNAAEQIMTKLGLYVWFEQANTVAEVAPWIDLNTVNENPTIGGGGDQPFFHWGYAPPNVVTFKELKLPIGATWSVNVDGNTLSNTTYQVGTASAGTIVFHLSNGTHALIITPSAGFGFAKITGLSQPNETSGSVTGGVSVTWTVLFGAVQQVNFAQNVLKPLYPGASWTVYLNTTLTHGGAASALASGTATSLPLFVPAGAVYGFQVQTPASNIYTVLPQHGVFTVPTHTLTKTVTFVLHAVTLIFHETGLTFPTNFWNITLTSGTGTGAAWYSAYCGDANRGVDSGICFLNKSALGNIVFHVPAGTYHWAETSDKTTVPTTGMITVTYPQAPVTTTLAYH